MQKTSVKGKNINTFSKQKDPYPRNCWRYSQEKCHSVRDFITEALWITLQLFQPKIWEVYSKKVATENNRFGASKEA